MLNNCNEYDLDRVRLDPIQFPLLATPLPTLHVPCSVLSGFSWCHKPSVEAHIHRVLHHPGEYVRYEGPCDPARQAVIRALFNSRQNLEQYLNIWLYVFAVEASFYAKESLVLSRQIIETTDLSGLELHATLGVKKLLPGYISTSVQITNMAEYGQWAGENISSMLEDFIAIKYER